MEVVVHVQDLCVTSSMAQDCDVIQQGMRLERGLTEMREKVSCKMFRIRRTLEGSRHRNV